MNDLHEPVVSNSFYFNQVLYSMYSKQSEDFVEVLSAWAKVIGVNLDR
ncbi:MAG: hypothetical protein OEM79_05425 [Nitrosopumilus sp.]|nr:hypothetical protein [Nitrosopumilus sp.]